MKETNNESTKSENLVPQAKADERLISEVLGGKTEPESTGKHEGTEGAGHSLFLSVMMNKEAGSGKSAETVADGKDGKDKDSKTGKDKKRSSDPSESIDDREHDKDPSRESREKDEKAKDNGLGSVGPKPTEVKADNSGGLLARASLLAMNSAGDSISSGSAVMRAVASGAAEIASKHEFGKNEIAASPNEGIAAPKIDNVNIPQASDKHEMRHGSEIDSKLIDVTVKTAALDVMGGAAASISISRSMAADLSRKDGGALGERKITALESSVSAAFNHVEPSSNMMSHTKLVDAVAPASGPAVAFPPKVTELVIPRPDTKSYNENLSTLHVSTPNVGDFSPHMVPKSIESSPAANVFVPLSNFHSADMGPSSVPPAATRELIAYNFHDIRGSANDIHPSVIGPIISGPIEKPPVVVHVPTPDVVQPIVKGGTTGIVVSGNGSDNSFGKTQMAFIPNSQKNFWEPDRQADQYKADKEAADRRTQDEKAKEAKAAEQKLAEQKALELAKEQKQQDQIKAQEQAKSRDKSAEPKHNAELKNEPAKNEPGKVREETVNKILDAAVKSFQASKAGHTIDSNKIESMTLNLAHLKNAENARSSSSGVPISQIISLAGGKEPEKSGVHKPADAGQQQAKTELPMGPVALTKNGLPQEKSAAPLESKAVQSNLAQSSVVLKAIEAGARGTNLNIEQATAKTQTNKSLEQAAVSQRTTDGILGVKNIEPPKTLSATKNGESKSDVLVSKSTDRVSQIAKFAGLTEASARLSSEVNIKSALRISPADLSGSTLRSWMGDTAKFRPDALPRVTESTLAAQNSALGQLKMNLSVPPEQRNILSGSNKQVNELNTKAASANASSELAINAAKRLSEEPRLLVNKLADALSNSKAFDTSLSAASPSNIVRANSLRGSELPSSAGLVNLDYVNRSLDSLKTWQAWAERTQGSQRKVSSKNRIPEDRIDRSLLKTDFYDIPEIAGIDAEDQKPVVPNKSAFLIALILSMSGVSRRRGSTVSAENVQGLLSSFSKVTGSEDNGNSFKNLHRRTHLVEPGDTLQSIAERYFSDSRVAWLIADLNSAAIDEHGLDVKRVVELKARQSLELPEAEEVQVFLAGIPRDFDIDQRLVTIVNDTMINMEVLKQFLGPIIGSLNAQDQSADQQKELLGEFTILGADCA